MKIIYYALVTVIVIFTSSCNEPEIITEKYTGFDTEYTRAKENEKYYIRFQVTEGRYTVTRSDVITDPEAYKKRLKKESAFKTVNIWSIVPMTDEQIINELFIKKHPG